MWFDAAPPAAADKGFARFRFYVPTKWWPSSERACARACCGCVSCAAALLLLSRCTAVAASESNPVQSSSKASLLEAACCSSHSSSLPKSIFLTERESRLLTPYRSSSVTLSPSASPKLAPGYDQLPFFYSTLLALITGCFSSVAASSTKKSRVRCRNS